MGTEQGAASGSCLAAGEKCAGNVLVRSGNGGDALGADGARRCAEGRGAAGCSLCVLCTRGCHPGALLHGINGSSFAMENGRQSELVQEEHGMHPGSREMLLLCCAWARAVLCRSRVPLWAQERAADTGLLCGAPEG